MHVSTISPCRGWCKCRVHRLLCFDYPMQPCWRSKPQADASPRCAGGHVSKPNFPNMSELPFNYTSGGVCLLFEFRELFLVLCDCFASHRCCNSLLPVFLMADRKTLNTDLASPWHKNNLTGQQNFKTSTPSPPPLLPPLFFVARKQLAGCVGVGLGWVGLYFLSAASIRRRHEQSGTIDQTELATVLRSLGYSPTKDQLTRLMSKVCVCVCRVRVPRTGK